MRKSGYYKKLGSIEYFIPYALPPKDPSLLIDSEMLSLYGQAIEQLSKLNEASTRIPDIKRPVRRSFFKDKYLTKFFSVGGFVKAYVIKEALLSSSIEGIHTTLTDVFSQNINIKKDKNTELVINYTKSLDYALSMIRKQKMPIVERVILNNHKILMQGSYSEKANPGEYRKQAVKVGSLVPPPANLIPELMAELETYININTSLPILIKAGLVHVQFETIHPFLDGNGRIGRLL